MNLIKEWYDGYVFGCNSEIYCTWSVISYVRSIITSLNLAKGDSECIAKILSSPPNLYWNNSFYKKSCLVLCDSTDENQKADSATDAVPLDKGNLDYQSIGMSKEVFDTTVSNVKAIMQSTGQDVNFALDMLRISGNLRGIIKMQI